VEANSTSGSSTRTWYLVRHGETEWNAASRMQGQLDSRLTPLGRAHARSSAELLARLGVDAIFASPLGRVRETIAIVEADVHAPVTFDDRLKEWHSGDWSGEQWSDLGRKWPDEFAAWEGDRWHARSPGGENFVDLIDRARGFFADAAQLRAARIAIVAHGFMNRALCAVLLDLPPAETLRIRQANDVVIRIVVTDGAVTSAEHFISGEGPRPGLPALAPVGASARPQTA
jgi:broad specificity phosphatase PhoE